MIKTCPQSHIALHTQTVKGDSSGSFQCDRGSCGNRFSEMRFLQNHVRIHDNDLLHCHFCPWAGNSNLVFHMNHHFHIQPYKCSYNCERKFYQYSDRRKHEESFHEIISNRYQCDMCTFKTHSTVLMGRHKNHKCSKR